MENNFETKIEEKKLGGGIITLAVLTFIFSALGIFSYIFTLVSLDKINELTQAANGTTISSTNIIIGIIISAIVIIGFILILRWKKVGIYLYYAATVLSIIISLITAESFTAFTFISIGISLIIPVLLAIFLKNKFKYFT